MIDRQATGRPPFHRVVPGWSILCAAALILAYWSTVASTPAFDWNATRIYPAFLLAGGVSPYATATSGPVTGWIYGPVMPLFYLPATLAPTLTSAVLVSGVINLLVLAGPMVLIVNDASRRAGLALRERGAILLGLLGLLPALPVLRSYLIWIHCDQVAIGLTLLSCWFLARFRCESSELNLGVAAVLAALAVWTKQIAVMLPLTQLLYLGGLRRDFRLFWRYLLWLLGAGAGTSAVAVLIFGTGPLVFCLWVVPGGHRLMGWAVFLRYAWVFVSHAGPCLALTLLLARFARKAPAQPAHDFQKDLLGLLLVTATGEIPMNLLAACKEGSNTNSFHALPLFFLAVFVALVAAAGWWRPRIPPARAAIAAGVVALAGATLLLTDSAFRLTPATRLEQARAIAERHLGHVYFPQNPLIVWWTERKPQPLELGLVDLSLAGFPITRVRYFESLPQDLQMVVYRNGQAGMAVQIFPGFKRREAPGVFDLYAGPTLAPAN